MLLIDQCGTYPRLYQRTYLAYAVLSEGAHPLCLGGMLEMATNLDPFPSGDFEFEWQLVPETVPINHPSVTAAQAHAARRALARLLRTNNEETTHASD